MKHCDTDGSPKQLWHPRKELLDLELEPGVSTAEVQGESERLPLEPSRVGERPNNSCHFSRNWGRAIGASGCLRITSVC